MSEKDVMGPSDDLVEYAVKMADLSLQSKSPKEQKERGQYFSPKEVGIFMSSLFVINKSSVRVLDPGAGVGLLSASFCQRILNSKHPIKRIEIDAYENDGSLTKYLNMALENCQKLLEKKEILLSFNTIEKDFTANVGGINSDKEFGTYDYIILNPPYFRYNTSIANTGNMGKKFNLPNIYALFIAISAQMLKVDGEIVFISPRSFCSGFLFRNFRRWLLNILELDQIHIFELRNHVFRKYAVLQENIIVKAHRSSEKNPDGKLLITRSRAGHFERLVKLCVRANKVLHERNGDVSIRIPTSEDDLQILDFVEKWPKTLRDLGFIVSTGPVVPFRSKSYLQNNSFDRVPLIWMHNIDKINLVWPKSGFEKPATIRVSEDSLSILLPVKNYVLMKRISSKEQRNRLTCAVLLRKRFPFDYVGLENHVNYIHKSNGEFSEKECIGLAGLLTCSLFDKYFGIISGHNQVNASDIHSLPAPEIQTINAIGEKLSSIGSVTQPIIDNIVASVLT